MRALNLIFIYYFVLILCSAASAQSPCTVPYQIANGQATDATQVMANYNALLACLNNAAPAGGANSVQYNGGSGAFGAVGPLTNGQLVIGSTGGAPQAAVLNAGSGVVITNGPGTITISATGGGGVAAPTAVQSAFTRTTAGETTATVTLTTSPSPGDLLLAIATGYGGSAATLGAPSNFNQVYSNVNLAAPNQGVVLAARVVQPGDTATYAGFSGGNGGNVFGLIELSGAHSVQANAFAGSQSGSVWPFFAGSAANAYTFFVMENDSSNTYEAVTNASLLFDGTSAGSGGGNSNHPAVLATIAAGSMANASIQYANSTFGTSLFAIVSVTP